jgi:DNA (cytosine-5)-methyltransferase 1
MSGKPRLLDLFSGIGGFSLGLEAAGYETAAFCEINAKCRHLLAHHWPAVPAFADVTKLTGEQVGTVDAICGGFPCQDISFAGKGAGITGERSGLWRHYARLIGELRPRNVFVENVAALLGRGLGDVLGDLASLGYDAWWDCIPAAAVGAPHRRDRLWLVAYPGSLEHEGYGAALRREIAARLSRAPAEQGVPTGHGSEADAQHPNPDSDGRHCARVHVIGGAELRDEQVSYPEPLGNDVADAERRRRKSGHVRLAAPTAELVASFRRQGRATDAGRPMDDTVRVRHGPPQGQVCTGLDRIISADWWSTEPDVGRVAHGVPARVDRLHGLGNAVVPQIPEILGRAVLTVNAMRKDAA